MPKAHYDGGKQRRHFTLSSQVYDHLSNLATEAQLSRSETVERILRSTGIEYGSIVSDDVWPEIIDHTIPLPPRPLSS
jgi:hypothetical protein